ncbi:beta-glucosidase family protein [Catenulispora acidiphila]|uniref:beta-glucosidase family protein n=1 Tax=Catenulispora acidiphila TaxID=304895 RepID=UPI0002DD3DB6|nr:glycoside hydrolase family 3 C-terminal domain-containing protein [Catenulispora acidiphila]
MTQASSDPGSRPLPGPLPRPGHRDAADILARLTLAEKIAMLHQHQPAVPRLGLAAFTTGCEALHGVGWIGRATVFPQAVGLGATWDRELLRRVGQAVSSEVRAFRQDTAKAMAKNEVAEKFPMVSLNVWAPVVNLLRDPRWGRNEEGYSEDPYATGEMAIAYCRGLRGDDPRVWRTAPLLKHFLAYNAETDRDIASATVPERVLHEYELPAFRRPIEDGAVAGVMPGYNLVNGIPNHVHPLIGSALRAWDAELAVCSDAQAPSNLVEREKYFDTHVESHAAALLAGIDSFTDNSQDSAPTIERFTEAFTRGLVSEADIDAAVGRVLLMRQRTGEFDPEGDPYAGIRAEVIASAEHAALALEAARAGVVLLRNEGGAPPLAEFSGAIAVVGHLGSRVLTDWYSGTLPYAVSIAEGLGAAAAVDGSDTVLLRSAGGEGGEFGPFKHVDWGTSVQCPQAVHTFQSVDSGLYLTVGDDSVVDAAAATPDGWVVRELFELEHVAGGVAVRSNATGRYVRVGADGVLIADSDTPEEIFTLQVLTSGLDEAARAAASAERVVLVVGNDPHINGRETIDRDSLALPPHQEALLAAVHAANPATTLVIVSSYPYAIDTQIPTILWTSHAGQELGTAIADILTGAHNPSARLPQTWYASADGLPDPYDYDIIGSEWTYQYSRRDHLWAFGHGLSYTDFEYSDLTLTRSDSDSDSDSDSTLTATLEVTNTGTRDGAEIVQLYTRSLDGDRRPLRKLAAFTKLHLPAGESQTVTFDVPLTELAFWDEAAQHFAIDKGRYEVLVGASSQDIRTRQEFSA